MRKKKDVLEILLSLFVLVHFKGDTTCWIALKKDGSEYLIRRLNFQEYSIMKKHLEIIEEGKR